MASPIFTVKRLVDRPLLGLRCGANLTATKRPLVSDDDVMEDADVRSRHRWCSSIMAFLPNLSGAEQVTAERGVFTPAPTSLPLTFTPPEEAPA